MSSTFFEELCGGEGCVADSQAFGEEVYGDELGAQMSQETLGFKLCGVLRGPGPPRGLQGRFGVSGLPRA